MKNVLLCLLFLASAALPSHAQFARHEWSNQLIGETYFQEDSSYLRPNLIEVDFFGDIVIGGTYSEQDTFSNRIFFKKSTADGDLLWIKELGEASSIDFPVIKDLTTDPEGNIYILGSCKGLFDVDPGPGTELVGSVSFDQRSHFIVKYDADGNYIWSYYKDTNHIHPISLVYNTFDDSLVLLSNYYSLPSPLVFASNNSDAILNPCISGFNFFLLNLSSEGNVNWVNSFGDGSYSNNVRGLGLLIDHNGDIIVQAYCSSALTIGGEEVGEQDVVSCLLLKFGEGTELEVLYDIKVNDNILSNGVYYLIANVFVDHPTSGRHDFYFDGDNFWVRLSMTNTDIIVNGSPIGVNASVNTNELLLKLDPSPDNIVALNFPENVRLISISGNGDGLLTLSGSFSESFDFDWTDGEYILSSAVGRSIYIAGLDTDGKLVFADMIPASEASYNYRMDHVEDNRFVLTGIFEGNMDIALNKDTSIVYQSGITNSGFEILFDVKVIKALCKDTVEVDMNSDGVFVLNAELLDDGSYAEYDCDLALRLDIDSLDCMDIDSGQLVELTVIDEDLGYYNTCESLIVPKGNIPTALCADITLNISDAGAVEINTEDIDNGSYDYCQLDELSLSQYSFDCENIGENTVTLTATNSSGLSADCEAKVIILDEVSPSIDCSDKTIYLDENGDIDSAALFDMVYISDNCEIEEAEFFLSIDDCAASTQGYPMEISARDFSGNESDCISTVFALDTISPTVICTDFTFNLINDEAQLVLGLDDISEDAWDNCQLSEMSFFPEILNIDDLGENTILVEATDIHGNTSSCSSIVTLTTPIKKEDLLFMPNVFSPNNDGINDQFAPFCSDKVEEVSVFTVMDRWGNIHYEKKDFEPVNDGIGWKGMNNGESSPKGVYLYQLRVLAINGVYYEFSGTVNLL